MWADKSLFEDHTLHFGFIFNRFYFKSTITTKHMLMRKFYFVNDYISSEIYVMLFLKVNIKAKISKMISNISFQQPRFGSISIN